MAIEYTKKRVVASELQIEEIVFSGAGGFLFGTAGGYAIKKVIKIAAVVIDLFVVAIHTYLQGVNRRKMGCNGECYKKRIDKCVRTGCSCT